MPPHRAHTAYHGLVIALGSLAVGHALWLTTTSPPDGRWLVLCVLTLSGAIATLRMRATRISFSISDTFTFAALLLFGPAPATVTASLEALTISCLLSREQRRPSRVAFNIGSVALAMWGAGQVLTLLDPSHGQVGPTASAAWLVVATAAAVATYFLINTWTVALAVAFESGQRPLATWRAHFLHLGLAYLAGGYSAVLLVLLAPSFTSMAFFLLAPLPMVLYALVRMWVGRVNDKISYLDRINQQYRATIEALAHAVDAKDQVTHGHIRRVQTACLQVARSLDCHDQGELHAIEAASLLHDLGKLAIPEHILNKPGRLTEGEFTRMKTHASIGADILAGIDFPYPVVPIVRHHHENWDGTGYPDGLAGEVIPLGARILSVVDCFDALTSDRPYRPAMSRADALAILDQRRGTMYDPRVVDEFMRLAPRIEVARSVEQPSRRAEPPQSRVMVPAAVPDRWADTPLATTGAAVLGLVARLVAGGAGVVFAYVEADDALEPMASLGLSRRVVGSLRMRLGERLSGWVAASRQGQRDSDPRLDLQDDAGSLGTATSLPIIDGERLVGVLALYARTPSDFVLAPATVLEALAGVIGQAPRQAGPTPPRDAATLSADDEELARVTTPA